MAARDRLAADSSHVPFVDLTAIDQKVVGELRAAFDRVLASGRFVSGEEVARFEASLAERLGVDHAIGVASGTAALTLTLRGAGVGPGDEVILPTNSFFATVEAVWAVHAVPILVDVDPATCSIDPVAVEAAVTERTAAIIVVHLYGIPVDVERVGAVARRHKLLLLEDAAQAMGASWDGRSVGSLGEAAAFSFFPTKNLGALGEAGAVTTNDAGLARRVRLLRSHGETPKHHHVEMGANERIDELQAAFLRVKLAHFDDALESRRQLATRYHRLLEPMHGVVAVTALERAQPAHHLLVIKVDNRDAVLASLGASGVDAAVHYPTPIHLQPACRYLGLGEGSLPTSERLARSVLSLPFFPGLTSDHMARAITVLSSALLET